MQENPVTGSKKSIVSFYRAQLRKFEKLGLGKETENRVAITPGLIEITKKRLAELSITYEQRLSKETVYGKKYWRNRKMKMYKSKGE